jgi:hypothetical protein
MNRYTPAFSVILLAATVSGGHATAGIPYSKIPAGAPSSAAARVVTREHKNTDFGLGTRLAGTRTYVAGGKGSLGVGLLLGPLGVAGNAAHVADVNRRRGSQLNDLVQTDVISVLQTVRQSDGAPEAAADEPAYDLLPSLQIRFDGDTRFHVGCLIQANLKTGKKEWRVRYAVELPGSYDSQSSDSVAAAARTVAPCFTEANRLFTAHIAGGMLPGSVQPANILGKAQKQPFVAEEYPARLILPDVVGLVEYAPTPLAAD